MLCAILAQSHSQTKNETNTDSLKFVLEGIHDLDQKYRHQAMKDKAEFGTSSPEFKATVKQLREADSINLIQVLSIIETNGWPERSVFGNKASGAAFLVIQHSNLETQEKYLPLLEQKAREGEADWADVALMKDRVLMNKGENQLYGSQVYFEKEAGEYKVWPIENEAGVAHRRKLVGLNPLHEYLKYWGIQYEFHPKPLSFFEVPLVCNAAPTIGCGSRSKPALLNLEDDDAIEEAWMNRTGTTFAVIWREKNGKNNDIALSILAKNNVNGDLVTNEVVIDSLSKSLLKKEGWYKGAAVDSLSLEEAKTISQRAIDVPLSVNIITQEEADLIYPELEDYFRIELVKLRTLDELLTDQEAFQEFVIETFERHIGQKRTKKMIKMYSSKRFVKKMNRRERKKSKCCSPSESKSCN